MRESGCGTERGGVGTAIGNPNTAWDGLGRKTRNGDLGTCTKGHIMPTTRYIVVATTATRRNATLRNQGRS